MSCSDLIPQGPAARDTRVPDATVDVDDATAELPDIAAQACESDADCADLAVCCLDVVCQAGVCMPSYVHRCCLQEGPCAVSTSLRTGMCEATCVPRGCIESLNLGVEHCDETLWELPPTPEGLATLAIQDAVADRVSWHLSRLRAFAGAPSLRAGDVLCATYYTGALDPRTCAPLAAGSDAGTVDLAFVTPSIDLPAGVPALVEMWVYAELPASDGLSTPLDGLELEVLAAGAAPLAIWSTRVTPIPVATWTPVLIDLSLWAGRPVQLRVSFTTLDGRDNDHEGVSIGRLRVRTACATDRFAEDRGPCEVAYVTEVRGLSDTLVTFGPPDPTRACVPCASAEACPRVDTCDVAECVAAEPGAGTCRVERELTPACCTPDVRWPGDGSFEGPLATTEHGDPQSWLVSGGWAVSGLQSRSGEHALHFGLPDGSGLALPGESAEGEILSPLLAVPEDSPRWRFWLWLATEWDPAPSTDNPAGLDLLEALVSVDAPIALGPAVAWDARAIGGTTSGTWLEVTIDLTPWRGTSVRLGWRFRTGDADANEGAGVYIDDAVVFRACPGCESGELGPGDPACGALAPSPPR